MSVSDEIRALRAEVSSLKSQMSKRTVEHVSIPHGMAVKEYYHPFAQGGMMLVEKDGKKYLAYLEGPINVTPNPDSHMVRWTHSPDTSQYEMDSLPEINGRDELGRFPFYPSTATLINIRDLSGSQVNSAEYDSIFSAMGSGDPYGFDHYSLVTNPGEKEPTLRDGISATKDGIKMSSPAGTMSMGKDGINLQGSINTPPANEHGITQDKLSVMQFIPQSIVTPFPSFLPNIKRIEKIVAIAVNFASLSSAIVSASNKIRKV